MQAVAPKWFVGASVPVIMANEVTHLSVPEAALKGRDRVLSPCTTSRSLIRQVILPDMQFGFRWGKVARSVAQMGV
jgi:hypothetical protein